MLTLVCVIVGVGGLKIEIDESASVFDLKKAILEKTSNTIKFGAHHLQLYLAKKDGVWLSANIADTILQSEVNTSSYLNIHSSFNLNQPELFGSGVSLGYDVIHVLTVIPSQVPPKRGSLTPAPTIPKFKQFDNRKKCLAECSLDQWKAGEVHNIPFIWKFMKPFGGCTEKKQIFWRLEEQQVVSILLDRWFPESSGDSTNVYADMQSILFGSPGIGKSTLLCMMAFYLILKHKKNVLVYRRFTNTVQFLLYFGYQDGKLVYFAKQRCKPELAVVIYEELRNRQDSSNVWLMLSGYDYKHIPEGLRTFRVLATAKEVELTPSELDHAYRCLLPCWKKQDLFELGRKIYKFEEGEKEMEVNFSYSGGSVRGFTMDFEDYMRDQERIGLLDGMFYFRFCHTFAKDTKNRDHYLSSTEWEQIFDSVSAVSWMTKEMQSKELLRHFHWARGTGHDALARITFIMCLQRLAIDNALILHVADYDPPKPNEEGISIWSGWK